MLKNTKKILMAGAILSTITMSTLFTNAYASPIISADINRSITIESPLIKDGKMDVVQYIKNANFLTVKEKKQLLDTEKQTSPLYEKIDKIYDKIDKISDRILVNTDDLYDKIDKIYEKQDKLWDKLFENVNEEQNGLVDNITFIRTSKSLTKAEVETLIKEQEKIDKIYDEIDKIYEKFDKEAAPLYKEIEELYKKIDKIEEKNKKIWEKVEKYDKTPILY